jgi:hypothetical protein
MVSLKKGETIHFSGLANRASGKMKTLILKNWNINFQKL